MVRNGIGFWNCNLWIVNARLVDILNNCCDRTDGKFKTKIRKPVIRLTRPALLLVDFQQGFDTISYWGSERNNFFAEENAAGLLHLWRQSNLPVFHLKHCSSNPVSLLNKSNPGNEFKQNLKPINDETVIEKSVNSGFIGTGLYDLLQEHKINTIVIAGLTTDHCVSTTTRMAGNLGFDTFVVSDATATFNRRGPDGKNYPAQLVHETALASLDSEFATIVATAFLLQKITSPAFR
ncbi:MAG: cysteine hydrolase [Chitinophagaceae bacterium]|nr:cysteine hydrolase [Chitinophagaceae bacterium]